MSSNVAFIDTSSIIALFHGTQNIESPAFKKLWKLIDKRKVVLLPTILYELKGNVVPNKKKESIDELVMYLNKERQNFKRLDKEVIKTHLDLSWKDFETLVQDGVKKYIEELSYIYKKSHVTEFGISISNSSGQSWWSWYKGDIVLVSAALVFINTRGSLFEKSNIIIVSEERRGLEQLYQEEAFLNRLRNCVKDKKERQPLLNNPIKIPDVCAIYGIKHYTLWDLLASFDY